MDKPEKKHGYQPVPVSDMCQSPNPGEKEIRFRPFTERVHPDKSKGGKNG